MPNPIRPKGNQPQKIRPTILAAIRNLNQARGQSGIDFQGSGLVDTTAPTVVIISAASTITTAAFTCTFTFSETVTGFVLGDITVGNGSAGTFSGSGAVYTAVITPTATGTVTVDVNAGVCADLSSNPNTAATQFSILYVSPALWLKADAGIFTDDAATTPATADGNVIAVWQDQSGNGNHLIQTSNGLRPLLKLTTNGINGRATIKFDGTDDYLSKTVANWQSGDSAGTFIGVYRIDTLADFKALFSSADTGTNTSYLCFFPYQQSGAKFPYIDERNAGDTADTVTGNTTIAAATTYIGVFSSSGTAYTIRINGTNNTLTINSGANNGDWLGDVTLRDNVVLGGMVRNSGSNLNINASVSELFYFSSQITGSPLTAIEAYLNARYAAF